MRTRAITLSLAGAGLIAASLLAASYSAGALKKLQSLSGDWEGKDEKGQSVKSSFKSIVSGTGVMETLSPSGMEQMVTVYSLDGDGIALIHFCPTNNQPRMRGVPGSGDVKELVFAFQGGTNLPDISIGHEQKLVLQFTSADQIVERWTWRKNGKDTEMIYTFTRSQGARR